MKSARILLLAVIAVAAVLLLGGSLRLATAATTRGAVVHEVVAPDVVARRPVSLTGLQDGLRLLAGNPVTATGYYSVTALGTLGGSGASVAYDINKDGQVVGYAATTGNLESRAFVWTDANNNLISGDGEMQPVGADGGLSSDAYAIADSGYIAGRTVYEHCFCGSEEERGESWLPFVRDPAGDVRELTGLGYIASPSDVNSAGTVVGNATKGTELGWLRLPAVWQDGSLSHPWDFRGDVDDINEAGDMVGEQVAAWDREDDDTEEAVALIDGTLIHLGALGGESSSAAAISNLGHVVGRAETIAGSSTSRHGFLWRDLDGDKQVDDQERIDLGTLGGQASMARDVNDAGVVVGTAQNATGDWRPFLWKDWDGNGQADAGEMVDLNALIPNDSGWVLGQATAINERGQIVGHGTFNGKANQAFLLTPPLEPWTVFFYLDGDNNLDATYIPIMNRLEQAADNEHVNIVVLWDRFEGPSRAYHVQHDEDMSSLAPYSEGVNTWTLSERDMSNPATLTDFVTWGVEVFPARHYALVLDDHGSGLGGGLTDDSSGGRMTLQGMEQALDGVHLQTGRKMDVLYMAMCLMGMLEDAYQFRDLASYYVANQTLQYAMNAPYDNYIDGIGEFTTPEGVALVFAASYADAAVSKKVPHSISVVETKQVELIANTANALGQTLEFYMEEVSPTLTLAAATVQRYDSNGDSTLSLLDSSIDLYDFAVVMKNLHPDNPAIQSAAGLVQAAVDFGVVYERHGDGKGMSLAGANGLAVFFPATASSFYNEDNYAFAVGGWPTPGRRAPENEGTWASMLVSYVAAVNPDGPDNPQPPPPVPKPLEDAPAPSARLLLPFVRR